MVGVWHRSFPLGKLVYTDYAMLNLLTLGCWLMDYPMEQQQLVTQIAVNCKWYKRMVSFSYKLLATYPITTKK